MGWRRGDQEARDSSSSPTRATAGMAPSDGEAQDPVNGTFYHESSSLPRQNSHLANGSSSEHAPMPQRYGGASLDAGTSMERSQQRMLDPNGDGDARAQRPKKDRKPSDKQRMCGKCGKHLTGQFVRALGDTYHLECFTCHVRDFRSCCEYED